MSKKVYDRKGRWRSTAMAFRISPEEIADLNIRVNLSGLTKQDYIIHRLQDRDIVVQSNPRVYKALRNQLETVLDELKRIDSGSSVNSDLLDTINLITVTLNGLKEEN
jgi:hypothetical protein